MQFYLYKIPPTAKHPESWGVAFDLEEFGIDPADYPVRRRRTGVATSRRRSRALAEVKGRKLQEEELQKVTAPSQGPTLYEAIELLLNHKRDRRLSPETIEIVNQKRVHLENYFCAVERGVDGRPLRDAKTRRLRLVQPEYDELAAMTDKARAEFIGNVPLFAIDLLDVVTFANGRLQEPVGKEGKTVSLVEVEKEVRVLREAWYACKAYGQWEGEVPKLIPEFLAPAKLRADRKRRKVGTRWLPPDELSAVLAVARADESPRFGSDYADGFVAYVYLGVRLSELDRLTAGDVDLRRGFVHVRGTKTDGADRFVPIPAPLAPILRGRVREREADDTVFPSYLNDGDEGLKSRNVNSRRTFHRWAKQAGVAPFSANDLRRTFVSLHFDAGTPERLLVLWMGHASSALIREVYGQPTDRAQREAADAMPDCVRTPVSKDGLVAVIGGRAGAAR